MFLIDASLQQGEESSQKNAEKSFYNLAFCFPFLIFGKYVIDDLAKSVP